MYVYKSLYVLRALNVVVCPVYFVVSMGLYHHLTLLTMSTISCLSGQMFQCVCISYKHTFVSVCFRPFNSIYV